MRRNTVALGAALIAFASIPLSAVAAADNGAARFQDRRNPPPYRVLTPTEREQFEFGQAIFNTSFVPAVTPKAARRDGLGPVFNAASCDACHNNGARAQGRSDSGAAPTGLVVQMAGAESADPVYGHVLNTNALEGVQPEAVVFIEYTERGGRYADGSAWVKREPRYVLRQLRFGAVADTTLIRPRLAPPLFGAGLLEAVPASAIEASIQGDARRSSGQIAWRMHKGNRLIGRFGWQAESVSLEEQTTRALSQEMGLTSRDAVRDDCSAVDRACLDAANGGKPEISDEFLDALLAFQRNLAVPLTIPLDPIGETAGATLFVSASCDVCHRPELPVSGVGPVTRIAVYTDLLVHDLGSGLADKTAAGRRGPQRAEPVAHRAAVGPGLRDQQWPPAGLAA